MFFRKKIKPRHLSLFYRRLSSMAATGMTMAEAIEALAEAGGRTAMGRLLTEMQARIVKGESAGMVLAENFRHLREFPPEILERGGREVSGAFSAIAEHIERETSMRNSFNNITLYPATVSVILLFILSCIMIFVVPVFADMYAAMGGALPAPTRLVMGLSGNIHILILLVIGTLLFFYRSRRALYFLLDKVPVLGRAARKLAAAEFMSTYTTLLDLGIGQEGMQRAAVASISNPYLSRRLGSMTEGAGRLGELVERMKKAGFLPDIVTQMIKASERTSTIESGFRESADMLFEEMDIFNRRFFAVATPLTVLCIGLLAGFVIISLYMPIFSIMTLV